MGMANHLIEIGEGKTGGKGEGACNKTRGPRGGKPEPSNPNPNPNPS